MSQFIQPTGVAELVEMLTYARPHRSSVEAAFVQRFIDPLGVEYDKFGNAYKRIGKAPQILWSCHTDTVHHKKGKQKIGVEGHIASVIDGKRGDCLGADDGAGVWLMAEMIRAQVPGLYIFHAGEEHGGLGSRFIATENADALTGIKAAIAFDRKGTRDIITHQAGGRCCSHNFAYSLATLLPKGYQPDDTGTFTDTANYTDLIGECTNISVGYEDAHSHLETLDLRHLVKLRNRMVKFDASALVFERQPGEHEQFPAWSSYDDPSEFDETLIELCQDYPEAAAELITKLGGNAEDMLHAIDMLGYGRR